MGAALTFLCLSFLPCWVGVGASAWVRDTWTYKGQVRVEAVGLPSGQQHPSSAIVPMWRWLPGLP